MQFVRTAPVCWLNILMESLLTLDSWSAELSICAWKKP